MLMDSVGLEFRGSCRDDLVLLHAVRGLSARLEGWKREDFCLRVWQLMLILSGSSLPLRVAWASSQLGGWFQGEASHRWRAKQKLHSFRDLAPKVTKRLFHHVLLTWGSDKPVPKHKVMEHRSHLSVGGVSVTWYKGIRDVCIFHNKYKRDLEI